MKVNLKHIGFMHRMRLGEIIDEYAEENGLLKCSMNVIAFLQTNHLLDEDAVLQYLQNVEKGELR